MMSKDSIDTVTFRTKGQIAIPRRARRLFEFEEGTRATVEATDAGILIKPVAPLDSKGSWDAEKERQAPGGGMGRA